MRELARDHRRQRAAHRAGVQGRDPRGAARAGGTATSTRSSAWSRRASAPRTTSRARPRSRRSARRGSGASDADQGRARAGARAQDLRRAARRRGAAEPRRADVLLQGQEVVPDVPRRPSRRRSARDLVPRAGRACRTWSSPRSRRGSSCPPYVGYRGWVGVRLDVDVDWDEVAGIVRDAYCMVGRRRSRRRSTTRGG